jgi:hypothetical protein
MKKIVLTAAVSAVLLFALAPAMAAGPAIHQEEIQQQIP